MSEINLLQGNQSQEQGLSLATILNKIGIGLLILVVVIYVLLAVSTSHQNSAADTASAQKSQLENTIQSGQNYSQLVSYQDKLHNVKLLMQKHLQWSMVLDKIDAATLKTAHFQKFVANSDGTATLTGTVPDFASLDRQIQAYQLNQFQYIKDVALVNVGLSSESKNGVQYTLKITFNTDLLQPYLVAAGINSGFNTAASTDNTDIAPPTNTVSQ